MNIDIDLLWSQREVILSIRSYNWIVKSGWVVPLLLLIPVLIAGFPRGLILGWMAVSAMYGCYAAVTHRSWREAVEGASHRKKRIAIVLVMGYDGISLGLISLAFLFAAYLLVPYLGLQSGWILAMVILALYAAMNVFALASARRSLGYLMAKHEKATPPATRTAVATASSLAGAGVGLAAVLRTSKLGLVTVIAISGLLAVVLAAFVAIILYQIVLLAIDLWQSNTGRA